MGFLDKTKIKRTRKRDSSKNQPVDIEPTPNTVIPFIAVKDQLPPNTDKMIITFEHPWGYAVIRSDVVLQHIKDDIRTTKKSRVSHWAELEK